MSKPRNLSKFSPSANGLVTSVNVDSTIVTINGVQIVSTNTTASPSIIYIITAGITLTLPSAPAVGARVYFSNRSGLTTPIIARNGQNIMGVAENLTLDNENAFGTLVYADATRGWIFQ